MFLLAASLFFSHPAPLDMPRAEAYLITGEDKTIRLEDRFRPDDLWLSRQTLGQWRDDDGRYFVVSRLDIVPPKTTATVTREEYSKSEAAIDPKKEFDLVRESIELLSPIEIAEDPCSPAQKIRGLEEVIFFEGTNTSAVVCAFRKDKSEPREIDVDKTTAPAEKKKLRQQPWYLITWELASGDDVGWARELLTKDVLEKSDAFFAKLGEDKAKKHNLSERELLRADARHSVENYEGWRVTDAEEFSVLDNLPAEVRFITALTNDLAVMRKRYREVMPSPVDGSNVLCVARIFSNRDDYLAAAGENMAWSAAYWTQQRRELVAYLPQGGAEELLRTIRHEAFHQYFSYAACMIPTSPWLNEGYAQYFEDEKSDDWQLDVSACDFDSLAAALPGIMGMDYEQFYDGTDRERSLKYRLAWSMAYFLENGAPQIRFQPFKDLKKDYVAALLKNHDMRLATIAAFGSKDKLDLFVAEWKKFWTR